MLQSHFRSIEQPFLVWTAEILLKNRDLAAGSAGMFLVQQRNRDLAGSALKITRPTVVGPWIVPSRTGCRQRCTHSGVSLPLAGPWSEFMRVRIIPAREENHCKTPGVLS